MNSIIQRIKVGATIKDKEANREYTIINVYPFWVLGRHRLDNGELVTKCFSYGDLVVMGFEEQKIQFKLLD